MPTFRLAHGTQQASHPINPTRQRPSIHPSPPDLLYSQLPAVVTTWLGDSIGRWEGEFWS